MEPVLLGLLVISLIASAFLFTAWRRVTARHRELEAEHDRTTVRFKDIIDVEQERDRVRGALEAERGRLQADIRATEANRSRALADAEAEKKRLAEESAACRATAEKIRAELNALEEKSELQSFGFYKPRYDFANSERYQAELERIRGEQQRMLKEKTAAVCSITWTVNGSASEGRKQINQTLKLMLRAFNGECDGCIGRVKYNNIDAMEKRIEKAHEAINSMASVQSSEITREYLRLKLAELHLAHEYQEKLQAEKEEQRRIREQMREEEVALRQIEKAREDAEKEERKYADALRKAQEEVEKAVGAKHDKLASQIEELQRRLAEAQANKERAISRAQMTRSGHVYVISNVGAFGEHVYKIGMTRRLDPMDRVKELGDASVPFDFDVHAVIFSEDAPTLETTLHRTFAERRVNLINERREFFYAHIDEIAAAARKHHADVEFTLVAIAEEYRKTLAKREELHAAGRVLPFMPRQMKEDAAAVG